MKTVGLYQEGSDTMDFKEALLKSVNKRKYLIQQKVAEVEDLTSKADPLLCLFHLISCMLAANM